MKAQKPTVALEGPFVVHGTPWAQGICGIMSTPRVLLGRGGAEGVEDVVDMDWMAGELDSSTVVVVSAVVVEGLGVTVVRKRVKVVVIVLSSSVLLILWNLLLGLWCKLVLADFARSSATLRA